jgi:serine/threonine-protein kinase RsbW
MRCVSEIFSERYPASALSVPMARHAVLDALAAAGFPDSDFQSRVALALTEATSNVVRHAYPQVENEHMEVVINQTAGAVVIAITDHGAGMDTRSELPGMGLGLAIMRTQTTNLEIASNTSGTIVTLHFERG